MGNFEMESLPERAVVVESFGRGAYMEYRIPGIVVTGQGTVICCYEGRRDTHNDWAPIDIVVCRSTDGGRSFTRKVIVSSSQDSWGPNLPDEGLAKRDPQDQAAVTWNNPVLIRDGDQVHLLFHKNYEEAYHCVSRDDGVTFSKPVDITAAFRQFPCSWNVCASGPGHGIVTANGRLLVPVWLANGEALDESGRKKAHNPSTAGAVYSDDRGKTWRAGVLVQGIVNANETTVVETGDGQILFNFRNQEPEGCRLLGISADGAEVFSKIWKETSLLDPGCFGSMIRIDEKRIGFVNCANSDKTHPLGARIFLTFYISVDDGASWNASLLVDRHGGYADIAVDGNQLYVFYEQSTWTGEQKRINHLILKQFRL